MREQIKLSQLRSLIAVAEAGNFSEAGLRLGISQSAVSHAIASLETEMGIVLFSRGRHGAHLTPVGERILNHAQDMMASLEQMEREANLARGLRGGDLRIGVFRSVATHVLPELLAQFRARYPDVKVSIQEFRGDDGTEDALRKGVADLGFICLPPTDEFECWELFRDEYVVLFPPTAEVPDRLAWDDLNHFPMILPEVNDYCSFIIHQHFEQLHHPLKAAYHIKEDSTIVSMVMRGLGITVMARLAAEPLPPSIQMRSLPVPLERVVRVAVMNGALHSPALYAFLDLLKTATYPTDLTSTPDLVPQS
ncbi:MAG: LysR family transcriptional regulator [Cyanobacteria bacterium J06638_20]